MRKARPSSVRPVAVDSETPALLLKMERCPTCNRKVLVSAQPCRCGCRFCPLHRLPEAHACTYDHKAEGRKVLAEVWEPRAPKIHGASSGGVA